jgi:CRP-like cAMP-binding protein
MPIEVRLAQALVALSGRSADSPPSAQPSSTYRDSIAITRTVLAQMCLTTVETAIRVTRMWEKSGKLDLSIKGIVRIVDPAFFEGIVRGHSLRL